MAKKIILVKQHSNNDDPRHTTYDDLEKAQKAAHRFFLSYGFTLKDGKADDGEGENRFDDVKIVKGRVVAFSHAGGYGPSCYITRG